MDSSVQTLFDEALALYKRNSWDEAAAKFELIASDAATNERLGIQLYHHRIYALAFGLKRYREAQGLCDEALAKFPNWTMGWFYAGRIAEELGNSLTAFGCFKRAIRSPEGTRGYAEYHAFGVLIDNRRYRAAAKLMPSLEKYRANFPAIAIKFAEIHLLNGRWERALVELDHHEHLAKPDGWSEILRRWAEAQKISASHILHRQSVRHIAIGGESYVGSTVLGTILGSLEGAAHIAESHWLTERVNADSSVGPIDFDAKDRRGIHWCRKCGPRCEVLSRDFREELEHDATDWYPRIAHRLNTTCLISSDKSFAHYWRLDTDSNFDLLVLYKTPSSHFRSYLKAANRKQELNIHVPDFARDRDQLLNNWCYNYRHLLGALHPRGKRIFINWEGFVAKPHEHFHRLLDLLDLPGSARVFSHIRANHYIGGNDAADDVIKAGKFVARSSFAAPLSQEDEQAVMAHLPSQKLFRLLETAYLRQFADLV